ncbi:MAG: glycosyltransferase family 2 protein [Paracoccaceae bacterium]
MKVSVIMANYRGAQHLFAGITSVLRQSHADLELIVSDDASPDGSLGIVRAAMAGDGRVRLIEAEVNAGPASARNRALDAASGDWIAIVDSDDLLHPNRLERLLAAAKRLNADMIADDLMFFGDTVEASGRTLLQPLDLCAPMFVTTSLFLEASGESRRLPALGYLKPLIRRSLIDTHRYDASLRIGEDYDFIVRLLMAGGRFAVIPDPTYLYRRHSASISHRLTESAVSAMLAAHDRVAEDAGASELSLLARRRRGLVALWRYECLLAAVRQRRFGYALGLLLRSPSLLGQILRSLGERFARPAMSDVEKPVAQLRLGLGLPHREMGQLLSVPCSAVPQAGGIWSAAPAKMAAVLSRLSARYCLSCVVEDEAGAWAAGLLPAGDTTSGAAIAPGAAASYPTGP